MKNLIISTLLIMMSIGSNAQTLLTENNRAYTRVGIEPTTMVTIGFERNFNELVAKRDVNFFAEWSSSMFRFSTQNSELKIGGIVPVFEYNRFKILNNANLSAGSVETINFTSKKFAFADELAIGFYWSKAFVALTAEYEKIYLNKIEHTDHYRTTYYEDAVDGWYKGGGGMFQFGLEGGYTIKKCVDLHMEVKLPFTEKFNAYGGSPLHVNFGVGYRF